MPRGPAFGCRCNASPVATLLVQILLALSVAPPRAKAAVCTTAARDVHFAITWKKVLNTGCWSHTLTKTPYTSLHDAHDACVRSVSCGGIHDVTCLGHVFYLCDSAHNFTAPRGRGRDNDDDRPTLRLCQTCGRE